MATTIRSRIAFQDGAVVAIGAPSGREVDGVVIVVGGGENVPLMRAVVAVWMRSYIGESICGLHENTQSD